MNILLYSLMAFFVINGSPVYRFQRTTLGIAWALTKSSDPLLQSMLTPSWIGLLGWIHKALLLGLTITLSFHFGWKVSVPFFAYGFLGMPLLDKILPLPSYRQCFSVIKDRLSRLAETPGEVGDEWKELLFKVNGVEEAIDPSVT